MGAGSMRLRGRDSWQLRVYLHVEEIISAEEVGLCVEDEAIEGRVFYPIPHPQPDSSERMGCGYADAPSSAISSTSKFVLIKTG